MHRWSSTMLLLLPLILNSGCVTHQLWTASELDEWNEPCEKANLHLYDAKSRNDYLVVYNEYLGRPDRIRTRAYFLNQNEKRIAHHVGPHFVSTNLAAAFPPVPVYDPPLPGNTNQLARLFAVASTNGQQFTIYFNNRELNSYHLPIYNDGQGLYERVALTPVAVTADATIVGCIVGAIWACERAGGSFDYPYSP